MHSGTFRSATRGDMPFAYWLHKATMREYVVQTWGGWDEAWQLAHFREAFSPQQSRILSVAGEPAGVLRLEEGPSGWSLHVLEIAPQWQRKGIGTCVLRWVLGRAAASQKAVNLQVLKVNPAKRLYQRLGFRKTGESATHIRMRGLPTQVDSRIPTEPVEKAVVYITHDDRLLVFCHRQHPEAGVQVPGGTLERGEEPARGALREAEEETGLAGLQLVRYLGAREHLVFASGSCQWQRWHFFHLTVHGECPEIWRHWEVNASDGSGPLEFELFWVPLRDGLPELSGALGELLPLLLSQSVG